MRTRTLRPYFCRCCVLHDRATVRWSDETPTMPCEHAGNAKGDCKRIEWSRRTFYCVRCHHIGKTVIVASETQPGAGDCPMFPMTHAAWEMTDEAKYALHGVPMGVEEGVTL